MRVIFRPDYYKKTPLLPRASGMYWVCGSFGCWQILNFAPFCGWGDFGENPSKIVSCSFRVFAKCFELHWNLRPPKPQKRRGNQVIPPSKRVLQPLPALFFITRKTLLVSPLLSPVLARKVSYCDMHCIFCTTCESYRSFLILVSNCLKKWRWRMFWCVKSAKMFFIGSPVQTDSGKTASKWCNIRFSRKITPYFDLLKKSSGNRAEMQFIKAEVEAKRSQTNRVNFLSGEQCLERSTNPKVVPKTEFLSHFLWDWQLAVS